ncbi:hypothetical protein EVAR_3733_1 [Eumeta japonica]|uniref:Helitron helicase-like domain-containing protein n=1 Tax=Eumeta variegata TaxID=151549 RepID=A0A4C1SS92_EUMVA|nr:hypothetical protein EVAR_3733_1 [Eumeta japonica]
MRLFLIGAVLFTLSSKLHTVANQKDGKERNSPFCVMSSLSAATVVSSTTAHFRHTDIQYPVAHTIAQHGPQSNTQIVKIDHRSLPALIRQTGMECSSPLGRLFQSALEHMPSDDTLQYPLMFWQREDGYYFNIKMKNLLNGDETTKKVSSMNYYAYRLIIRQNADNYLLRFRRLLQQYCVDMYVKIETERLTFIRLNQAKLCSEKYIHLRDAISTEGNAANIGRLTILPATYIGSPRHMHEYAQDAMTYVRHYGRPNVFITFTCNPKWIEIVQLLLPEQTSSDRYDITTHVFRHKMRSLMNYIVKQRVFGDTRCYDIICAEIPDHEADPDLHDVVVTNMIHGPCGAINPQSPCMVDGKYSKQYPRTSTAETVTDNDGYLLYRRRSSDDNCRTITTKVKRMDFVVGNS